MENTTHEEASLQHSSKRLFYLDFLRGMAILLMVVDHAFDWWLNAAARTGPLALTTKFLGTFAAPLFLFLVGVGLVLSTAKADRNGVSRLSTVLRFLQRGALIFLGGFLLNLVVFYTGGNLQDVWAADVLHAIGLSIICMLPLILLPAPVVLLMLFGLLVAGQTAPAWALPGWLEPFLVTGYFPLALWLPYACLGVVFGKFFHQGRLQMRDAFILAGVGILGLLLIPLVSSAWGYRHPRPVFVLFSADGIVWLILAAWYLTEHLAWRGPIMRVVQQMGRASLMLYVFHHLVGYRLFWLFGWVTGRSWRGEFGIFSTWQAAGLFVTLIALMVFASGWWLDRPKLVGHWKAIFKTSSA